MTMTLVGKARFDDPRLRALIRREGVDLQADPVFANITALAARLLDVPIVLVNRPRHGAGSPCSYYGLEVHAADRVPGLFESALPGNGPYVVRDALVDARTASHPLVTGEFGLRSYAAVPLQSASRLHVGHLCCMDFQPRDFGEREIETLRGLAEIVMDQIELQSALEQASVRRVG